MNMQYWTECRIQMYDMRDGEIFNGGEGAKECRGSGGEQSLKYLMMEAGMDGQRWREPEEVFDRVYDRHE